MTSCDNCIHNPVCEWKNYNHDKSKCEYYTININIPNKGEWKAITSCIDTDIHIVCSNCKEEFIGKSTLEEWKKEYLFCHRCGADMRDIEK